MLQLVTAAQMREMDRRTIEEVGIPGIVLMERAGLAAAEAVRELLKAQGGRRVCVLAGKGNNGGDGFVVARHLAEEGYSVQVFLFGLSEQIQGDARTNLDIWQRLGGNLTEITSADQLGTVETTLAQTDVVVDALLGTGLSRAPREPLASAIHLINRSGKPVMAVDVPSGLDSDSGAVYEGCCVRATCTVTFGAAKIGLMVYPGAGYVGHLTIADIGIPRFLMETQEPSVSLTTGEDLRSFLPPRPLDAHKGNFGRVLILAGSPGFTGAAILAGRAAMRAGSGLVTVGIPASLNPILESCLLEAMTIPLPETPQQTLAPAALEAILNFLDRADAVAIGPGLSQHDQTAALLRDLLPCLNPPTVLDADALNLLARDDFRFADIAAPLVLTPHPGEMARLLRRSTADIQANRLAAARGAAERFQAVVVLKGARTIIAAPDGRTAINPTGNPGLASGGTGDVLTGILASLLGQGLSTFDAAVGAAYLHGLAGDLAIAQGSTAALIASDLIEWLPQAWREVSETDVGSPSLFRGIPDSAADRVAPPPVRTARRQ